MGYKVVGLTAKQKKELCLIMGSGMHSHVRGWERENILLKQSDI